MNSLLSAVLTVFLDVFFSHHEWAPQWWLRHPTLNDRDGGLSLRWKVTYFSPHLDPLPYESCTSRTHRLPRSHHFRVNSHHWHLLTPVARLHPTSQARLPASPLWLPRAKQPGCSPSLAPWSFSQPERSSCFGVWLRPSTCHCSTGGLKACSNCAE